MTGTDRRGRDLTDAHVAVTAVGRDEGRLAALPEPRSRVLGDVTDARLGDQLLAVVEREHGGRLDGLVNAAGVVAFGTLVDTDDTVIEQLFLTNVVGPLFLLRRVIPTLARSHGFIAQTSGLVAERPTGGMVAYSASKAARERELSADAFRGL